MVPLLIGPSLVTPCTRRLVVSGLASEAVLSRLLPPQPGVAELASEPLPVQRLSADEIDALLARSRTDTGVLLPSGVRVIDLVEGSGPQPTRGTRVWASFKVWASAWDSGQVADLSFLDGRPYDWVLGQPTDRMPKGVDEAVAGMREGGWRRLVVPPSLAYGDAGLRTKSSRQIKPGEPAFVDVRLMDGGSGRCDAILRLANMKKSVSCERGKP